MSKNSRVTEAMSFRLSSNDLHQLRELAAQRKESLNALVSQIIDKYLKLWVFDHSYGFFSVGQGVLRSSLAKLNDDEIKSIAMEQASKAHKGVLMNLYGRITKETVVNYLDIFCTRFESFKHFKDGKSHTLAIFHGVDSLEFSKLYYYIICSILGLASIIALESEREIDANNFALSFEVSP